MPLVNGVGELHSTTMEATMDSFFQVSNFILQSTNILNKEDNAYISEFMEPYLKFAIARAEEKVVFTIQMCMIQQMASGKKELFRQ